MPPKVAVTKNGVPHDVDSYLVNCDPLTAELLLKQVRRKAVLDDNPVVAAVKELEDELLTRVGGDAVVDHLTVPAEDRANLSIMGYNTPLPMTRKSAEILHSMSNQCTFFREGDGDVYDPNFRSSREIGVYGLGDLSERWIKFDFPEAVARIHQTLCPTAEKIAFRPHKLVIYKRGDFFKMHVDTMEHKLQFGTVAVHFPVQDPPKAAKAGGGEARADDGSEDDLEAEGDSEDDSDEESGMSAADIPTDGIDDEGAGHLLLRIGREVSTTYFPDRDRVCESQVEGWKRNTGWNRHDKHVKDEDELTLRINMKGGGLEQPDGGLKVQYAAWLGDVPHEVTPVRKGYRIVLTYRMFKKGEVPLRIPRWGHIDTLVQRVFSHLPLAMPPPKAEGRLCDFRVEEHGPLIGVAHLAILLRHVYPIAGLEPAALKGLDALTYQVMSHRHECKLLHAMEVRVDIPANAFHLNTHDSSATFGPVLRTVWNTTEDPRKQFDISRERAELKIRGIPMICNAVWMQLGFGRLLGGGNSFGNADCGASFFYRSAVLIVTNKSSAWQRRKWLIYAGLYGPETMQRLFSVQDVMEGVCSFA